MLEQEFNKWYDSQIREVDFRLSNLLMAGKTLTHDDLERFWTLFKDACKGAYYAGATANK